jgi:hypothetical protein
MKVGGKQGARPVSFLRESICRSRDRGDQTDLVGDLWRVIAERLRMQNGMLIFSNFLYQRRSDVVSRIIKLVWSKKLNSLSQEVFCAFFWFFFHLPFLLYLVAVISVSWLVYL